MSSHANKNENLREAFKFFLFSLVADEVKSLFLALKEIFLLPFFLFLHHSKLLWGHSKLSIRSSRLRFRNSGAQKVNLFLILHFLPNFEMYTPHLPYWNIFPLKLLLLWGRKKTFSIFGIFSHVILFIGDFATPLFMASKFSFKIEWIQVIQVNFSEKAIFILPIFVKILFNSGKTWCFFRSSSLC